MLSKPFYHKQACQIVNLHHNSGLLPAHSNAAKRPKPERAADDRPSSSTQVPVAGTRELADSVEPLMQQLSFASPTKRLKPAHRSDGQPSGSSQTPEAESTGQLKRKELDRSFYCKSQVRWGPKKLKKNPLGPNQLVAPGPVTTRLVLDPVATPRNALFCLLQSKRVNQLLIFTCQAHVADGCSGAKNPSLLHSTVKGNSPCSTVQEVQEAVEECVADFIELYKQGGHKNPAAPKAPARQFLNKQDGFQQLLTVRLPGC
ncbi:hypothetical protein WJX82_003585 [Trebouxia sp. C0006]